MAINSTAGFQPKIDFPLANWIKTSALAHSSVLIGRCLFSFIFIMASFGHFSNSTINYAASQGVPLPQVLVPLSGVLALLGGLSILLGYHARIGALFIILFLVPVTLMMHNFWAITDVAQAQIQQIMFMKNLSMLGGALLVFNFGAGPVSFDERKH
ncbi:MAG: DoxX family protein [Bacteriovorax sp.]